MDAGSSPGDAGRTGSAAGDARHRDRADHAAAGVCSGLSDCHRHSGVGDRTDGVPVPDTAGGIHLVPHHPVAADVVPPGAERTELITSLNRSLAGWANYFRHGVSKAIFDAVDHHAWNRLMRWIRARYAGKHRLGMRALRRRFCDQGRRFACNGVAFTGASSVAVTRYRYRGNTIATPWTPKPAAAHTSG